MSVRPYPLLYNSSNTLIFVCRWAYPDRLRVGCMKKGSTYGLGGDNMVLLALIETGNSLDAEVVGLCCSRSEDDLLGISSDQLCNVLHSNE